jgi:hypothetical protein
LQSVAQAFTVGDVRFVMTDTSSERTGRSMLGERQRAWLLDELGRASREHALVVWVNPDPWIGAADTTSDTWSGFSRERREIANFISEHHIRNLVMVSGDAHMVAIDDGTHSDYSKNGRAGFPVLQAAALDRPGNIKGGPYSEGAFPGGGQFGVLRIEDDGSTVKVALSGRNWRGKTIVSYRFTVPWPAA